MGLWDALGSLNPLNLVKEIGNVAGQFITTDEEKRQFELESFALVQAYDMEREKSLRQELESKQAITVAEIQSGDNYTRRARPTVVYSGLGILFINHVLLPWIAHFAGMQVPTINLPTEFWVGWSGIVATWSIGRTFEKRGAQNKIVQAITG